MNDIEISNSEWSAEPEYGFNAAESENAAALSWLIEAERFDADT